MHAVTAISNIHSKFRRLRSSPRLGVLDLDLLNLKIRRSEPVRRSHPLKRYLLVSLRVVVDCERRKKKLRPDGVPDPLEKVLPSVAGRDKGDSISVLDLSSAAQSASAFSRLWPESGGEVREVARRRCGVKLSGKVLEEFIDVAAMVSVPYER